MVNKTPETKPTRSELKNKIQNPKINIKIKTPNQKIVCFQTNFPIQKQLDLARSCVEDVVATIPRLRLFLVYGFWFCFIVRLIFFSTPTCDGCLFLPYSQFNPIKHK